MAALLCEWVRAWGIYPEGLCWIRYRERRRNTVYGAREGGLLLCVNVERDRKGGHEEQRNG